MQRMGIMKVQLQKLTNEMAICKVKDLSEFDMTQEIYFIGKTDEELSLVCCEDAVPSNATDKDPGWKAMRITGILDFSLIGIISRITTILADNSIGLFVVSTYNTDYVLIKKENFENAVKVLSDNGYEFV